MLKERFFNSNGIRPSSNARISFVVFVHMITLTIILLGVIPSASGYFQFYRFGDEIPVVHSNAIAGDGLVSTFEVAAFSRFFGPQKASVSDEDQPLLNTTLRMFDQVTVNACLCGREKCSKSIKDMRGGVVIIDNYFSREPGCGITEAYHAASALGLAGFLMGSTHSINAAFMGYFVNVHEGDRGRTTRQKPMIFGECNLVTLDPRVMTALRQEKGRIHLRLSPRNDWDAMYSSISCQILLRWLPCALSILNVLYAGRIQWIRGFQPVKTSMVVLWVELICSAVYSIVYALGHYLIDDIISLNAMLFFLVVHLHVKFCVAIVLWCYCHEVYRSSIQMRRFRDPLSTWPRSFVAIGLLTFIAYFPALPEMILDTTISSWLVIFAACFVATLFIIIVMYFHISYRIYRSTLCDRLNQRWIHHLHRFAINQFLSGALFLIYLISIPISTLAVFWSPLGYLAVITIVTNIGPVLVFIQINLLTKPPQEQPEQTRVEHNKRLLNRLYRGLHGEGWHQNDNWGTNEPLDTWFGVYTKDCEIVALLLPDNGCVGVLDLGILAHLHDLRRCVLAENQITKVVFTGNMSTRALSLHNLDLLDVSRNNLTGVVPPTLSNLPSSTSILLHGNPCLQFLPVCSNEARALKQLWHKMGGENWRVPEGAAPWIWSSNEGDVFDLSGWHGVTVVDGSVVALDLRRSNCVGYLSGEPFRDLRRLRYLNISHNRFRGELPAELGSKMSDLGFVILNDNRFTGIIPAGLLSSHRRLHMSSFGDHGLDGGGGNVWRNNGAVSMDCAVFPMYVMGRDAYMSLSSLPDHEQAHKEGLLLRRTDILSPYQTYLFVNSQGEICKVNREAIVFLSHTWQTPHYCARCRYGKCKGMGHPDGEDSSALKNSQALLERYPDLRFVWMDYMSIPQNQDVRKGHWKDIAISSLPNMVRSCGVFVVLSDDRDHFKNVILSRGWCCLEILTAWCPTTYIGYKPGKTVMFVSCRNADADGSFEFDLPGTIPDPMCGRFSSDEWDLLDEERDRIRLAPLVQAIRQLIGAHMRFEGGVKLFSSKNDSLKASSKQAHLSNHVNVCSSDPRPSEHTLVHTQYMRVIDADRADNSPKSLNEASEWNEPSELTTTSTSAGSGSTEQDLSHFACGSEFKLVKCSKE